MFVLTDFLLSLSTAPTSPPSYGYGQLSTERGFSLDDSLRSVVGRAIAVHAHPFGSTASNPVIAWGIFGLANPGADTNVAR